MHTRSLDKVAERRLVSADSDGSFTIDMNESQAAMGQALAGYEFL
jgi:hypothetical protein